jgi:hypothetical protein
MQVGAYALADVEEILFVTNLTLAFASLGYFHSYGGLKVSPSIPGFDIERLGVSLIPSISWPRFCVAFPIGSVMFGPSPIVVGGKRG